MPWQDDLAKAARTVQERSGRTLNFEPEWIRLTPRSERPGVAAVDGSHAVLADTGSVWVVAMRAAAVHWPGVPPEAPTELVAVGPEDAIQHLEQRYTQHGLAAPPVHGAEGFAEALRRLGEYEAILKGITELPDGGLMLIDGALEHLPRHATELMERVTHAANRHHVALAAVAKKSRLETDGVPLVATLQRLARAEGRDHCWAVPVPGHSMAFVASLHAKAEHAFRIDVTAPEVLHDLLPLSRDAVYTGYPYPLAVAHNAVAISHAQARSMRDRLGDEVRKQGGGPAWSLLSDFHDVLDSNAPRL